MRTAIAITMLLTAPLTAVAQTDTMHTCSTDMIVQTADVQWKPVPPVPPILPKGAQIAVLCGRLSEKGPFVLRLKLPAGYQIPAHHHPGEEYVTVISGNFHAGMGDKLDKKKTTLLRTGGFIRMDAGMNHYAWASSETVVQVHGAGPFTTEYVDPADDPGS
jgi:quercetin dioxygenase-like cupin family protein